MLLPFVGAALIACQTSTYPDASPASSVTRAEALAIAESYRSHTWRPSKRHIFHGYDADGVRVDTPDAGFRPAHGTMVGWWQPGQTNVGTPYKWGGFDTPATFDRALRRGQYAGDVYTAEKRAALYDGVSRHAAGVDCSGFVSRCWRLPRHYSTRDLPRISTALPSWQALLPGDIINRENDHVMLFVAFAGHDPDELIVYDSGGPPDAKVVLRRWSASMLGELGFEPRRYVNIRDY